MMARRRWPLLALAALGLGGAVGGASFLLQEHFQQAFQDGARLAGWQEFLRRGAPWQALPPVLAGAVLALIGWLRLGRAKPEPSFGLSSAAPPSAPALRSMLRRERRVVLGVADAVSVLVGMVVVRLALYGGLAAAGDQLALATIPGLVFEVLSWLACGGAVWGWRRRYLDRLEGWGA